MASINSPAGEPGWDCGQAGVAQGDVLQRHVEDRGAAAVDGHRNLRLGHPHHPGHVAQDELLHRVGRIEVVVDRPAVMDAEGQHGGVLAGAGMLQGAGLPPGLGQGLGRGLMQGRMRAALQGLGFQAQALQDGGDQKGLEILAGEGPGKEGQFRGPESEGLRRPAGQDRQGLEGLGQGAQADQDFRVADLMVQFAGGIRHHNLAAMAALHFRPAGYFH